MGIIASFVIGRNFARTARGAPLLDEPGDPKQLKAYIAELEAALEELNEHAENLKARADDLETALETAVAPLMATLLLPGVKAWVLNQFHPDKHPNATPEQRAAYETATKVINEAYAL